MAEPRRYSVLEKGYRLKAQRGYEQDGAIILTDIGAQQDPPDWEALAASVPSLVWDDLMLQTHTATAVHLEQDGMKELAKKALPPHTDGYIWGDKFPDVVILLCEQPDTSRGALVDSQNGANYLIDGEAVMRELDRDTLHILKTEPVEHVEIKEAQAGEDLVVSINPVFTTSKKNGSLQWRRMIQYDFVDGKKEITPRVYISQWRASQPKVQSALKTLDSCIYELDKQAQRFSLQRGEALLVNNFRFLHARESITGSGRCMWRVWSWTANSNGLPETESVPATVHEASAVLRESASR